MPEPQRQYGKGELYDEVSKGLKEQVDKGSPGNIDDLKSWAQSLSWRAQQDAARLDVELQKRYGPGNGLLSPRLSPEDKQKVKDLFSATVPHWRNSMERSQRRKEQGSAGRKYVPKGGELPDTGPKSWEGAPPKPPAGQPSAPPSPRGRSSELPEVPNAVAALGGQMMMEDE